MKIIAFAGSNSINSINKKLVNYTSKLFKNAEVELLDLNEFPLPVFSVDIEKEKGFPDEVNKFLDKIASADLLLVSLAENNGSYNACFKNIFDWNSRVNPKQFQGKPMLLMATSPGQRGGASVLETAKNTFPRHGANILATFSLPSFYDNFSEERGITNEKLKDELNEIVTNLSLI